MRKARRHRGWEASPPRPMKARWGPLCFLLSLVSFGRVCSADRAVAAAAAVLVETTSSPSHRQDDESIEFEIDAAGGQIPRHHGGGKETGAGKGMGEIMVKLSWAWIGSLCCSCILTYFVLHSGITTEFNTKYSYEFSLTDQNILRYCSTFTSSITYYYCCTVVRVVLSVLLILTYCCMLLPTQSK